LRILNDQKPWLKLLRLSLLVFLIYLRGGILQVYVFPFLDL
jgi:hypothetical protein